MDELTPRARAYLEAFAQEHQAPAGVPPCRPQSSATAASSLRLLWPLLGIAAMAAAAWGTSRATAIEVTDDKRFEAAPHQVERRATEATEATEAASPRERISWPPRIEIDVAPPEAAAAVDEPPRPPRPTGPSSLRRELALVDAAKSALRRGHHATARRWLQRHAKDFPAGLLAPERRRLLTRIDEHTESEQCVHSSCVRSDDEQEPER
jgi:hypothetical protein